MGKNKYDVIIIGGGPAGLTSGIYLARAKTKILIVNEGIIGGQTVLTHEIANYPGIESINGYMLARTMQKQAETFGCEIKSNINVTKISLEGKEKSVEINEKETFTAKAIILATGGKSRELNVSGEKDFAGRGVSYCATCDGDFFQDKEIIVVGGGNSALEEAVALTKYASKVTIVHEFDYFQAHKQAVKEAEENSKIDYIFDSTVSGFFGNASLEKVTIKNLKTGEETDKKIDGVFIFIGYIPQTQFLNNVIKLSERGEILTNEDLETNISGVFAAGDTRQKKFRQVTTAVSDGTIAALNAYEFIQNG